jgi:hypothetical protein
MRKIRDAGTRSYVSRGSSTAKTGNKDSLRPIADVKPAAPACFSFGRTGLSTLSTETRGAGKGFITGYLEAYPMSSALHETAIDEIVARCNGDLRGALKALLLVNEQLEAELAELHAAVGGLTKPNRNALH